jgi:uncharacterized membrane protein YgcG
MGAGNPESKAPDGPLIATYVTAAALKLSDGRRLHAVRKEGAAKVSSLIDGSVHHETTASAHWSGWVLDIANLAKIIADVPDGYAALGVRYLSGRESGDLRLVDFQPVVTGSPLECSWGRRERDEDAACRELAEEALVDPSRLPLGKFCFGRDRGKDVATTSVTLEHDCVLAAQRPHASGRDAKAFKVQVLIIGPEDVVHAHAKLAAERAVALDDNIGGFTVIPVVALRARYPVPAARASASPPRVPRYRPPTGDGGGWGESRRGGGSWRDSRSSGGSSWSGSRRQTTSFRGGGGGCDPSGAEAWFAARMGGKHG